MGDNGEFDIDVQDGANAGEFVINEDGTWQICGDCCEPTTIPDVYVDGEWNAGESCAEVSCPGGAEGDPCQMRRDIQGQPWTYGPFMAYTAELATGTYRITYTDGAIRRGTGTWKWNDAPIKIVECVDGVETDAPGSWIGYDSAVEAEAASVGLYIDLVIADATILGFYWHDHPVNDNSGAVVFSVERIA